MSAAVSFTAPPPGFEPHVEFTLAAIDGADGLYSLTAAEDRGLRVFVVDPAIYLPEYLPRFSAELLEAIGLGSAQDPQVLVVARPGGEATTVNLLAPVLLNPETGQGSQVILSDQHWPVQAELRA
ncbi:flagellar assembly protein FliW [Arthrobacter frigidicola]|nr:flagellar assembly protein FliW [Arthrobacter frigidicola]